MARYGYGISVSGSRTAIVASATPAPSDISLTAPEIYFSGLTISNGFDWTDPNFYSPYTLQTTGVWVSSAPFPNGSVFNFGGIWYLKVPATDPDGNPNSAEVATITAPATSLPRTGWVNVQDYLTVSGTLVISTTP
jgi:hypothetical protein